MRSWKNIIFLFDLMYSINISRLIYYSCKQLHMDLSEDPIKKQNSGEQLDEELEDQQNFSSFDSNDPRHDHDHMRESSLSIDQNGFRTHNGYRQKPMSFPEVPPYLGQLYQIYVHNVNRKKELKKVIEQLIEKQIKAIRIAYDKQNYSIEEYIDLEEQSQQFLASKENFQKREKQLERLNQQYRELKIMQVQSLMVLDPLLKKTLLSFTKKTKQILHVDVRMQTVIILTKQKQKLRKIRKQKPKKGTKKLLKAEQQNELQTLQKGLRSRNTSRTASEDEQNEQQKIKQKYLLRSFKYFKTEHGVSFEPFQQLVELPDKQWKGVLYCDKYSSQTSKRYLGYQNNRMYILQSQNVHKTPTIKHQYSYSAPILCCTSTPTYTYTCLTNGIVYKYQPQKQSPYLLLKQIFVCKNPLNQNSPLTYFTVSQNTDIIIFVTDDKKLYEFNTKNYTTYLLSELPEKIRFLDQRLIVTDSCVFLDYYVGEGVGYGKAVLQFNGKVRNLAKGRNIVKVQKIDHEDYVILREADQGDFAVERLSKVEEPAKK